MALVNMLFEIGLQKVLVIFSNWNYSNYQKKQHSSSDMTFFFITFRKDAQKKDTNSVFVEIFK